MISILVSLVERQFLAESRRDHVSRGSCHRRSHRSIFFVVGRHACRSANKRAGCRRFDGLLALAGIDLKLAFALVVDANRVHARDVVDHGDQGHPAVRGVDVVEGEPHPGAAGLARGLDFIDMAADFGARWEGGAVGGSYWLDRAGCEATPGFRIL